MTRDEFVVSYQIFAAEAMRRSEKARAEGILSLEDYSASERDKIYAREIFEYGLTYVLDGIDHEYIDTILSNIIAQEKDEYTRLLKTIQKAAVLSIQKGDNPTMLALLLNSYTDLSWKEDANLWERIQAIKAYWEEMSRQRLLKNQSNLT